MKPLLMVMLLCAACEPSGGDAPPDVVAPDATAATDTTSTTAPADTNDPSDVDVHVVPRACPTTFDTGTDEQVTPQTVFSLNPLVSAERYQWSVTQPVGSKSVFYPSASVGNPHFDANVAGTYEIQLDTTVDGEACPPVRRMLSVVPGSLLHVELLWLTPGNPDETNEGAVAGTDLDLHLAHPFAARDGDDNDGDGQPDGWFHSLFDCFWFNEHPNWNVLGPTEEDDPSLDRDDTDGAGPENLNLDVLESGGCYQIGVHYWEDNDYGSTSVTVRVYLASALVFESPVTSLRERDMWSVTSVCEGATTPPQLIQVCEGTFTSCTSAADCDGVACGPRIAHDYTGGPPH